MDPNVGQQEVELVTHDLPLVVRDNRVEDDTLWRVILEVFQGGVLEFGAVFAAALCVYQPLVAAPHHVVAAGDHTHVHLVLGSDGGGGTCDGGSE